MKTRPDKGSGQRLRDLDMSKSLVRSRRTATAVQLLTLPVILPEFRSVRGVALAPCVAAVLRPRDQRRQVQVGAGDPCPAGETIRLTPSSTRICCLTHV